MGKRKALGYRDRGVHRYGFDEQFQLLHHPLNRFTREKLGVICPLAVDGMALAVNINVNKYLECVASSRIRRDSEIKPVKFGYRTAVGLDGKDEWNQRNLGSVSLNI